MKPLSLIGNNYYSPTRLGHVFHASRVSLRTSYYRIHLGRPHGGPRATKKRRIGGLEAWLTACVVLLSRASRAMDSQEDSIDIAKLKRFALGLAVRAHYSVAYASLSKR